MNIFQCYWHKHGTKIIGFGTAVVGFLEYVDHATVQLIETSLGPKWGAFVSHLILVAAGLATAYRGFKNSQKASLPPPSPETSR